MPQQPQLMDLSRMLDIFTPHFAQIRDNIYFNNELAVVHGDTTVFRLLMRQKPPFSINDHRMGIVLQGEADINFNLQDRHIVAGTLVYLGPGSIITPLRFSKDLRIVGIALLTDFPMPFAQEKMPSAFNGQLRDFQLPANDDDIATARSIIDTIWHILHTADYHRPTITSLVAALMHHYDRLFRQQTDIQASSRSREQGIFDRFLQLVNQECRDHHKLAHYAERMCLTARYLGTVVRQASGITAKEWIDRAIMAQARVLLRHSDMSILQVSDELRFPNPSFFCRFFRSHEGCSPQEYRKTM